MRADSASLATEVQDTAGKFLSNWRRHNQCKVFPEARQRWRSFVGYWKNGPDTARRPASCSLLLPPDRAAINFIPLERFVGRAETRERFTWASRHAGTREPIGGPLSTFPYVGTRTWDTRVHARTHPRIAFRGFSNRVAIRVYGGCPAVLFPTGVILQRGWMAVINVEWLMILLGQGGASRFSKPAISNLVGLL